MGAFHQQITSPVQTAGNVSGQNINQGGRGNPPPTINYNPPPTNYKSTGPLNALYQNKYVPTSYKFPLNLDADAGSSHIIQFSINETNGSTVTPQSDSTGVTTGVNITSSNPSVEKTGKSEARTWQPERTRISNTISLYIPDTMSTSYSFNYNETSLAEGLQDIGNGLGSAGNALSTLGGEGNIGIKALTGFTGSVISGTGGFINGLINAAQSSAGKLAASKLGVAFNPRKQVLFEGLDFRTFNFAFTFSPTNAQESQAANDIVRLFKYHAAPTIQSGAVQGFFFIPPSSFTIEFLYNNYDSVNQQGNIVTNPYLPKIAECVLTSVDVNYAPNGIWSAFDGTGAPTQIQLNLAFKEIELIDKTLIGDVGDASGGF